MKSSRIALLALVGLSGLTSSTALLAADPPVLVSADGVKWGPVPPVLPSGAQFAVLLGDPGKEGPYVVRVKAPDGYRLPPHWHPQDEYVTVLSGAFHVGMGETFDASKGETLLPGSFVSAPAGMRHYAWTSGETVLQIHGMGPFGITYVNAADDPQRKQ